MGFSTHPHIPTQPPLYSLEGWMLETAVSGLLYLQWKVTERFLKIDTFTLWLLWKRRNNSWNTLPCIEYIWVIDVNNIFQIPVCFFCRKNYFGKASFCLLSVKSGKRFALLLTTTKPSCDTCFSVELRGPTGIVESEEDVSDVRLSIHTSPLLCCCSRVKDLPSFLWTACSHSRKVTVPARDGLRTWAVPSIRICGFSALFCLARRIFTCGMEEMNVLLLPSLFCLQVNELVQETRNLWL